MPGKLAAELKQTRPFDLIEEEAVLNIARTAEVLEQALGVFLREFDLTHTHYNVLRILRGAGKAGATCSQISERMISRDPDITRLLDRMEARGLLSRERSAEDRRVVLTRIAPDGLAMVNSIDKPLRAFLRGRMSGINRENLTGLIGQLEQVRELFGQSRNE